MKVLCGWKTVTFKNTDPTKVYYELESLEKITPENIVLKAEDKKTELHKCFEWNNNKAANEYRKYQARTIVNNIEIISIEPGKGKNKKLELNVPAFEHVNSDGGRYINIIAGIDCLDTRKEILEGIKSLLAQATNKLDKYNEIVEILLSK